MAERSPLMMETLLGLHKHRDAQTMLSGMLSQLQTEYGRAVACCYLLDHADGQFQLIMLDDGDGESGRTLRRTDFRPPVVVPRMNLGPALDAFIESGVPVNLSEKTPAILNDLWGKPTTEMFYTVTRVKYAATAPITSVHGAEGVLVLFAIDKWPIEDAAECTAHAAVAIGNICERQASVQTDGRDTDTGLYVRAVADQAAEREINRCERYRRMMSVAVIELPADGSSQVRKATGALVSKVIRIPDTAARLDGNRLVVLLPETPTGGADAFLGRLREQTPPELGKLTAAASSYPQDGLTWDALLKVATERLHQREVLPIPGAAARGSLRAAMGTFRGGATDRTTRFG